MPILIAEEPEVFIFVSPTTVSPPFPVRSPAAVIVPVPVVSMSPGVVKSPLLEILIDGVERKLLNPVADSKLIPFIVLLLLLLAAGKFIPFIVFVLLELIALVNSRLKPLVVVKLADVLLFVRANK